MKRKLTKRLESKNRNLTLNLSFDLQNSDVFRFFLCKQKHKICVYLREPQTPNLISLKLIPIRISKQLHRWLLTKTSCKSNYSKLSLFLCVLLDILNKYFISFKLNTRQNLWNNFFNEINFRWIFSWKFFFSFRCWN